MEKSAAPPRQQAPARLSIQRRASRVEDREDPETADSDASSADHARASSRGDGNPSNEGKRGASGGDATPRIDRAVRTRTQDRITLPLSGVEDAASSGGGDPLLRGWRSPHGEPYRPLGNPNLGLKFTPRLHGEPAKNRTPLDGPTKDAGGGRRDPSTTTTTSSRGETGRPSPPPGAALVLDMFPRNLRKRPPEDRQVRLALRLQESISQYSPDKTRGLRRTNPVSVTRVMGHERGEDGATTWGDDDEDGGDLHATLRRLQEQHRRSPSPSKSPAASPRYHVQHGDASFLLLRGAVQQGVARLQLVRNGQNFLGAIPSSDSHDLAELKRRYDVARDKYLAELDTRRKLGTVIHLGSTKAANQAAGESDSDGDSDDDTNPTPHQQPNRHANGKGRHDAHEAPLYLPYTTRAPQPSPHKPLPTLAEFKAKAREDRMPLRALVSNRASVATGGAATAPNDPRSPTSPRSGPGSGASPVRQTVQSIAALTPSQPPKLSRAQTRRGSVVLTARASVLGIATGDARDSRGSVDTGNDALARAVASVAASYEPPPPRVHSVVRLQGAVDSVEAVKDEHAQMLAKTLAALDHDRRDCLETKYRNLAIDTQLEVDMQGMRSSAELDRVDHVTRNLASYSWYPELLRQLIASRESSHALHPAEHFCLEVIRHVAREGHAFQREQLFRLVLLLHADDVAAVEVQQILTFLRRTLNIAPSDWASFFRTHRLPEPIEIFKPSEETKLKEKKKQMRMTKFRSVVRIHQVLRRLTSPKAQQ